MRITSVLSNIIAQHGSFAEASKYYSYRGMRILSPDTATDTLLIEIDIPCDKLTSDNLCALHDKPSVKPLICHRYPWFPDDIETCGYRWK